MTLRTWIIHLFNINASGTPRQRGKCRLELEHLEQRLQPSVVHSPIDGLGNHVAKPTWSDPGADPVRMSRATHADGHSALARAQNPGTRPARDALNHRTNPDQPGQVLNTLERKNLSDFDRAWGQSLSRDRDLAPRASGQFLTITTASTDQAKMVDKAFEQLTVDFSTGATNPHQQINAVTSFLDVSEVSGSNASVAEALHVQVGGLMKTSPGSMLPHDNSVYFAATQLEITNVAKNVRAIQTDELIVTGGARGIEQVESTTVQTQIVRTPNHVAANRQADHPARSDEQLHQGAGQLNIAGHQEIVHNHDLADRPVREALKSITGHDSSIERAIASEFSTLELRIGRQRDGGIGSFDQIHETTGLPHVRSFAQISSDPRVQAESPIASGKPNGHDSVGQINSDPRVQAGFPIASEKPDGHDSVGQAIEATPEITTLQNDVFVFQASGSGIAFTTSSLGQERTRQRGSARHTAETMDDIGQERTRQRRSARHTAETMDDSSEVLATTIAVSRGGLTDQLA